MINSKKWTSKIEQSKVRILEISSIWYLRAIEKNERMAVFRKTNIAAGIRSCHNSNTLVCGTISKAKHSSVSAHANAYTHSLIVRHRHIGFRDGGWQVRPYTEKKHASRNGNVCYTLRSLDISAHARASRENRNPDKSLTVDSFSISSGTLRRIGILKHNPRRVFREICRRARGRERERVWKAIDSSKRSRTHAERCLTFKANDASSPDSPPVAATAVRLISVMELPTVCI